ncbi:toll/interleukin-1 receptor domain-containing protein [Aeromonas hydrophila]|uniref:toll/interleukin-1 receptor domain-containing protein n=1 Tax=Aeromonas hydrophila TaxID=644 RepID=UPI0014558A73|nr:toll/interleukin-1 receptor domain-containing protein [Aeromonas hydrophila]MBQ4677003.1 TIR domain-containing protein [Aeromonas hydrophila]MBW3813606.1 TIR domain-containing protein [Aeromonas hydrophila]MCF7678838.1 toll/interleukin-1 receptor domain-containing protein [Aeromonas hydrophila]MCF7691886.1 toll/interleukin-1 receptor domain-containing protein [Aeromonas hydrophila]MCF7772686.1 toll/interleukin-1 receptor domain-containing protein [Aeromonas hydrophila]
MTIVEHTFIIRLDYGDRAGERKFVSDVLDTFDRNTLCGANLFINNDPYGLELLLSLNFEKDGDKFEQWLKEKYPSKRREYRLLFEDITAAMHKKGYNVMGLLDSSMLEFSMPSEANGIFLIPDRDVVASIWGRPTAPSSFSVFLSHSSRDKPLVDVVFNELHKAGIRAWYDRYEIEPGDSITDKINEGLASSKFGLLFFSKNFLDPRSGWPKAEANYFFQKLMREGTKNFAIINSDLSVDELPALLQDRRFIDMNSPSAISEIVECVRKQSLL